MISKCLLQKTARSFFVVMLLLGSLLSNEMMAQGGKTVSGVIIDETGMPIPGANVIEKGTKNSASTDFDGKFSIRVAGSKSELVFSYLGYETLTQTVGQKTTLNVALKSATTKLDDVVIIGYGTSKKSDLTGAVSSVSGADLKKVAVANVAESLTGRVAGVQVATSEGSPDADVKIKIRGGGSLTQDSSPLIIVDGFPVNSMSDISPNDVENITVLKDASSTAIYGSRGANGVIIITTKSGKNNKITVSYNGFLGAKVMSNKIAVLTPEDFAKWQYEYAKLKTRTVGEPQGKTDDYDKYFAPYQSYAGVEGDDWQENIYGRTGKIQSHDFGIRGGSDKLSYSFGYALYDEKSIMESSDYRRNNLSLNVKNKATDKVDLAFTVRYSKTQIGGGGSNDQKEVSSSDSRLKQVIGYSPIELVGLTSTDDDEQSADYLTNPYVSVADNDRYQERTNFNMLGSFSWKIIKNMQFKSEFGLDVYDDLDNKFYGQTSYYSRQNAPAEYKNMPAIYMSNIKENRYRNANTLNYDFKGLIKSDNHALKILVGEETIKETSNELKTVVDGLPKSFDFDTARKLTSAGDPNYVDNYSYPDDKLLSFFGRLNYDYKGRYLLTGTFRADGSSKFEGENRWGYFPSVAAAWKINEESFLKDVKWVRSLKARLSYGEAGNNNIPVGKTLPVYTVNSEKAYINKVESFWSTGDVLSNPDLKWETTTTQNFGIDYDLFDGRLSGSFDLYKNIVSDLLFEIPIYGVGYKTQYDNMGETQNTGFEASVNIAAIRKEDYDLGFVFNIGFNKNEITSLGDRVDYEASSGWGSTSLLPTYDYAVWKGQSIGMMYGFQNDGRYEVSDFKINPTTGAFDKSSTGEFILKDGVAVNTLAGPVVPGAMKLKDLNGDGKVDSEDAGIIGNSNPKNTGGLVINGRIKNFDIMAAFNWSYGNDVYNANKIEFTSVLQSSPNGQYRNLSAVMADGARWTNLDPTTNELVTDPAALQALNANTTMWSPQMSKFVFSDWAVEDASFLRLNNLTIGYSLPEKITSRLGISKLRFYQTMNNVFVVTNYSGPDPEVNTRKKTPLTPGVDYSAYPRSRQIVFGLNLAF